MRDGRFSKFSHSVQKTARKNTQCPKLIILQRLKPSHGLPPLQDGRFSKYFISLRPRLYGKKLSRVEGSPAYPSYSGRANFSYISLQNLANRLHEKQKVGSARRVTRLAGLPFCDGRVTFLAGPTFLHINTLARLAGSTRSRRDDQSMRELCCYWKVSSWLWQRGQLFSHINAR